MYPRQHLRQKWTTRWLSVKVMTSLWILRRLFVVKCLFRDRVPSWSVRYPHFVEYRTSAVKLWMMDDSISEQGHGSTLLRYLHVCGKFCVVLSCPRPIKVDVKNVSRFKLWTVDSSITMMFGWFLVSEKSLLYFQRREDERNDFAGVLQISPYNVLW